MVCSKEQEDKVVDYSKTLADDNSYDGNWCTSELVQKGYLEAKWYDFEDTFPAFAAKFPDVLFIVNGDGDDSDDLWEARFKGNEIERHYMSMPPFTNPVLLTESEKSNITKNA